MLVCDRKLGLGWGWMLDAPAHPFVTILWPRVICSCLSCAFEFPPSLIAQLVVNPQIRRIPETRTKKPAKSDKKEFNDDTLKTTKTRTPSSQHHSWDYGNDEQRETKRDGVYRKILWLHSHCLPRNESSYTNRWVVTSLKAKRRHNLFVSWCSPGLCLLLVRVFSVFSMIICFLANVLYNESHKFSL